MLFKQRKNALFFLAVLILPVLIGCAGTSVSLPTTSPPATNTAGLPVPNPTATQPAATPIPPSPSVTLVPSLPSATSAGGQNQTTIIYLIALGDNGQHGKKVGCGDSVVPLELQSPPSQDPIKAALDTLLSIHDQLVGPSSLYNALYQSNLQVESITVDENGKATVQLTGTYALGGVCDDPRFKAQIEETVLQFPQAKEVSVFINGTPLDDILSEKGASPTSGTTYQKANIFLIALNDNGASGKQVGCGDSVVPVEVEIAPTDDPAEAIKAALEALLSAGDKYSGGAGLYNALSSTELQVDSASMDNGNATVQLSGSLNLGGECDDPRVGAQLQETVLQFPEVSQASIFINGKTLEEVLSLK